MMNRICAILLALSFWGCGDQSTTPPADDKVEVEKEADKTPDKPKGDIPAPSDVAEAPADAKKTESGLAYKVIEAGDDGSGAHPTATSVVKVHYTGWQTDGKMFDSSRKRGQPASFPLNRVIPGWTEGLQLMKPGDKFRFWIPEDLAYRGREPSGTLVFDVELLEVPQAPKAPESVGSPPADATTTASGLAYKILKSVDEGEHPAEDSKVTVNYTGWTADGEAFDSSVLRGRPATIPLDRHIPGWREGVQLMKKGETARFWIPQDLAYGGAPGQPEGVLTFDVELLSFVTPKKVPAPADVAAPPADASKTASGLAYKVLKPGEGDATPGPLDVVTVHYTGWTTDGKMFDSSVVRDRTASFPLNRVIAGWTEGLQLMKKGEKTRFWIPVDLAYKNMPGKPAGMLVFDVELMDWKVTEPPKPAGDEAAGAK
jgi:peptidylprolyl isomerase